MNQTKYIGLSNKEISYLLNFNELLKKNTLHEETRKISIDLYCDFLNALHPECGLQN